MQMQVGVLVSFTYSLFSLNTPANHQASPDPPFPTFVITCLDIVFVFINSYNF